MNDRNPEFEELLDFLKQTRSFDFTGYKRASLVRRVDKRMQILGLASYTDFQDYLQVHPDEFTHLFNTILINVTEFFRDQPAWDYLAEQIIPKILAARANDEPVRVWSAGCASGEEAYSIAILFADVLGERQFKERVKIYATDVDEESLTKARNATFVEKEIQSIPEEYRQRYFKPVNGIYTFDKELRRSLIFGRNDLILDAPISRVDLLVCRNTLMYFNTETQTKILNRFHFALRESGFLFLGKAETLLTQTQAFTPVDLNLHIFRKASQVNLRDKMTMMAQGGDGGGMNNLINLTRVRETSFEASPVAMLVVDINNTLMLVNLAARNLLSITPNDNGRPINELDVFFRSLELRSAVERSFTKRLSMILDNVPVQTSAGELRSCEVRLQPLFDNGSGIIGVCVSFIDITRHLLQEKRLEASNRDLAIALQDLQSANEEMETTNEELQSTMEEMETTNEELQSANEEMETMNEELQSTNEEMRSIYEQLKVRTEDLDKINSFMDAILLSLNMGVAVLDTDLHILIWNAKAEDLWGLFSEEVHMKNFLGLDIGLPLNEMVNPIQACLSGADGKSFVVDAINRRGREIKCRVECLPLYTEDHIRNGLIVTMVDETVIPVENAKDGG